MVKKKTSKPYIEDSICSDASYVWTNNMSEWQVKDTETGERLVHRKVVGGSPNVAEFLAIIDAMIYLEKENKTVPIYSDSQVALKWIEGGLCRTKVSLTNELKEMIAEYQNILSVVKNNHTVLKWNTKEWGEIPADFGRKNRK